MQRSCRRMERHIIEAPGRTRPYSITLWWLVRGCPTRVVGRTRTMLHNTLVLVQVSESQENQAKQQNSRNLNGCPTRGAGRTPTMFHNTLVVSSSPTSSTTQSPATGETTGLALGRKLGMS